MNRFLRQAMQDSENYVIEMDYAGLFQLQGFAQLFSHHGRVLAFE